MFDHLSIGVENLDRAAAFYDAALSALSYVRLSHNARSVCYGHRLAKVCHRRHHGTMTTMNVSLPDPLRTWVDQRVASGDFGSCSEYVRDLIRRDKSRTELRGLIMEGLASESIGEPSSQYWDRKRALIERSATPR